MRAHRPACHAARSASILHAMSYDENIDFAFVLIGFGKLLLYIALVRPQWLDFIPRNHWFGGLYRASRFGSIVSAVTCILFGAWTLGAIAPELKGLVFVAWTTVVVIAAIHDAVRSVPVSRDTASKRVR
jgi:hypothetical protein